MKIVLAGGTGFIGKALRKKLLSAGYEVIVLTRKTKTGENEHEKFVAWDGKTVGSWAACLNGADAVINLAGENIALKRWTAARKQVILSSRIDATRAIVNAIGQIKRKPAVLINASAVGYYGNVPGEELTETSSRGDGFLAEICEQWETEARKAESHGIRVVVARLGPVLGEQGGVLSRMLPPFRFFVGAPLGAGKQWVPWVHQEDVARVFLFMLERADLAGPVNVTAPVPVTMKEFCSALGKALHRPSWFPVPGFFIKILLGEMASIVLSSQRAIPRKLLQAGYEFQYPCLSMAFGAIFKKEA